MTAPDGIQVLYFDELLRDLQGLALSLKENPLYAAAAVLAVAALGVWRFLQRGRRSKVQDAILEIRERSACRPEEAYALYASFLARGGEASQIPAAALVAFLSPAREGELLRVLADAAARLPAGYLLDAVSALAEKKRTGTARLLLTDRLLERASQAPKDADKAVAVFLKLTEVGALVGERSRSLTPDCRLALAAALERQGLPEKALELRESTAPRDPRTLRLKAQVLFAQGHPGEAVEFLNTLGRPEWNDADIILALRCHVALRDTGRSRDVFASLRLRKSLPAKEVPDVYYEYGAFMEAHGEDRAALEAFSRLQADAVDFKDGLQRWQRLRDQASAAPPPAPAGPALPAPAAAVPAPQAAPGRIGGKYELRRLIGKGGMGQVFEAWDHSLERRVAVKKMAAEIKDSPKLRERFLEEAKIVSHLSHPFIVPIHEIVQEGGEIYLVFDFVEGRSLSQVLDEKGRLGFQECREVFRSVCQAVDHAHRSRVLHRDLKPANVMVDVHGLARVMDFGVARRAQDAAHHEVIGTPLYMAPEQHLGTATPASDVFALGVCLYECLAGEAPFKGPDYLAQKQRAKYKPLSSVAAGLPAGIDAVVGEALATDPARRPPDAMGLLQRLLAL